MGNVNVTLSCRHWPKKIFVVRHGQSIWNRTKRVSGQLDPILSAEGCDQAESLRRVLGDEDLTAVYTSDLRRAVATARPTAEAHGLTIHRREELREQHLGAAQGRFRDHRDPEIETFWKRRRADMAGFRIPGGESYAELEARVMGCLSRILHDHGDGTVFIVGHRNTNRILLGALLDWPTEMAVQATLRARYLYEIVPMAQPTVRTINLGGAREGVCHEGLRL